MYKSALIFSFIIISFIFLANPQKSFAQYVCNGTFTCSKTTTTCQDSGGNVCIQGEPGCNCVPATESINQDCSTTSPSGSSCDAANMNLYCINSGYNTVTDNCITTAVTPTPTPAPCGGGFYTVCGGVTCCDAANFCAYYSTGTPAGCCPNGTTFDGNLCQPPGGGATPTPTPTPTGGGTGCVPGATSCSGNQFCTCSAGGVNNCAPCGGFSVCTSTGGAPQCTSQICSPGASAYTCGGTSCR